MNEKIDFSKELNSAQLEAVKSTEGQYLVIAGAGSGKTRVLVYRVAYLVEKGVKPDEILLLTFTRKAAEEMLRRASRILDNRCQGVSGGTFHSFANMVLRRYAALLGFNNNFTILDRPDAEDILSLIRTKLGFHKLERRFPRKKALLDIISKSINKEAVLDDIIYDEYPQFIEWKEEIKKIQEEYKKYKASKSVLDYDDLLVYLRDLLVKFDDVRLKLSAKYKYIMVDEYQDTNKLQAYISCLLASEHKNIMVVGDDSQSIYSFRGANFRNIMDFPKIFQEAKIITLEENYRSTQEILNLTNEVIRYAQEGYPKNLYTKKIGSSLPIYIEARDEHSQSEYIADKILALREEGLELSDIAVLFRSGWHSNDLEVELANRNIPFVKYGGQKFVEAAHIKDIMSYLRIYHNLFDGVSWHRLLLLLPKIGPKSASVIIEDVVRKKALDINDKFCQKNKSLKELFELLLNARGMDNNPAEMLRLSLKHYQPLLKEKYDDFNKRLNDLDSLIRIAQRYDLIESFLSDMALEPPERNIVEGAIKDKDDSRLTLSTIHSAKGLEWHTVFMIYVAEGHLPSYLSLESNEAIEEERRLFYVAATRAKENLFLIKPHIDRSARNYFSESTSVFTRVSRFLEEGGILEKFVDIESKLPEDFFDTDLDDEEIKARVPDKEFLRMMKEYFRNSDDY